MKSTCAALLLQGFLFVAPAGAAEWFDLNDKALARFDFEGLALPTSSKQLEKEFPQAQRDETREDKAIGLECYRVSDMAHADGARFYFCDGRLYQFEVEYDLDRVKSLGGMQTVLQKLVDTWGPADHAGESRWTWQRPTYKRRADFYVWPQGAQLTITDMAWMPIVEARVSRTDKAKPVNLGF